MLGAVGSMGGNVSEGTKMVVRRLVDEVLNRGDLDVLPELYSPGLVEGARAWISPFRAAFPDVHMEVVELIAEADLVVGRFTCSATHLGPWRGHDATGRRFERVDEVSIYRILDSKIVEVWGIEDDLGRLQQLGLAVTDAAATPE